MRNGVRVEEDSNHITSQIIVDTSANTTYNNTLRVRERERGLYGCTVRNNKHDYIAQDATGGEHSTVKMVSGNLLHS